MMILISVHRAASVFRTGMSRASTAAIRRRGHCARGRTRISLVGLFVMVLASLFAAASASARDRTADDRWHPDSDVPRITVRVQNYAQVPDAALAQAKAVADAIYQHSGIETMWLDCPVTAGEAGSYPACRQPMSPGDLVLRIQPQAPGTLANLNESALGLAFLSPDRGLATAASVFYDRVEELAWNGLRQSTEGIFGSNLPAGHYAAVTLGLVMAHEMGHLLLGAGSHSNEGLMRSSWSNTDLEKAMKGELRFSACQVEQVNKAVRMRAQSRQAS